MSSVRPRIVIIMPCYNGEKYLEKVIDAFMAQDYEKKLLIIVDSKSNDSSWQVISKHARNSDSIVWDKTPDNGISHAINVGLKHVSDHDIFGYLGADDVLLPGILSQVANLFAIADELDGVYYDSYSCVGGGLKARKCPTSLFSLANLIKFGTIAGLQNIYIRGAHVQAQQFDETNRYSMDYDLYLRLAKAKKTNFLHIELPSTVNIMDGNISSRWARQGSREALAAIIKHIGYSPRVVMRMCRLYLRGG